MFKENRDQNNRIKDVLDEHEHFVEQNDRDLEIINDDNDYYSPQRGKTYYKKKLSYEEEQIARGY